MANKREDMTQIRRRRAIVIVTCILFFKTLILFGILPAFQKTNPQIYNADMFPDGYDLIAQNLIEGHGYRMYPETSETLIRTPGFILILAGIFALAGKSLTAIKALHLILSMITGLLCYKLTARLTGSDLTALIASLVYLFYPATVIAESRGGVEVTLTLILILFIFLSYRSLDSLAIRDFTLLGIVFGFGLLVKSSLAPGLPAIYLFSIIKKGTNISKWKLTSLFVLSGIIASLFLSPWIIRNYRLTGKFVPTMTLGGLAAFQGLYVIEHSSSEKQHYELLGEAVSLQAKIADDMRLSVKHGFFPQFYSAADELRYYDALGETVKAKYLKSPMLLKKVILQNSWRFWFQGKTNKSTVLNILLTVPFLFLVAIGILIALRKRLLIGLLLVFLCSFIALHLPIIAIARFYVPLVPLLAIFAALALSSTILSLRPSKSPVY